MKVSEQVERSVKEMSVVLRQGNRALEYYAEQVAFWLRKNTGNPSAVYTRADCLKDILASDGWSVRGFDLDPDDFHAIRAVKALEGDLYVAFQDMIWDIAERTKRRLDTELDVEDVFAEGRVIFLHGMYFYTRDDVKFSTYIYHCVRRGMFRAINKHNPFSPICNHGIELYARFEATRRGLNRPATLEEVVDAMGGLDEQERQLLMSVQVRMVGAHGTDDSHDVSDYTEVEAERQWEDEQDEGDEDQSLALRDVDLSANQRVVLEAWLGDGESGWQTRLAKRWGKSRAYVNKLKLQIEALVREAYLARTAEQAVA